jgi:hypothetical protein
MSGLPSIACPCCNVMMPLEAWIAHAATREAFLALASLHPSQRLPMTVMRYIGLFSPLKQNLRWERIADLMVEIKDLIAAGTVGVKHQTLPAPLEYWLMGMEECLARRDRLTLPLSSHGYLKTIVAGYSNKAEAGAEKADHDRRGGFTPVGGQVARMEPGRNPGMLATTAPAKPRAAMPAHIKDQLKQFTRSPDTNPGDTAPPLPATQGENHGD